MLKLILLLVVFSACSETNYITTPRCENTKVVSYDADVVKLCEQYIKDTKPCEVQ